MKILAVDDSDLVRDMLSAYCNNIGYSNFQTACSGEEALSILRSEQEPFDCLLFDISMPGITGIELCAAVRTMPRYNCTPIIMLTSMRTQEFIDESFKAGASDYVTKPFVLSDLSECLQNAAELITSYKFQISLTDSLDHNLLSHQINLPGFREVVRFNALGKYLKQMSSVNLSCLQVMAVKVDNFETLCVRSTLEELQYALCEVVDAICHTLKSNAHILSYKGEGIFIVISGFGHVTGATEIESNIMDILDRKDSEFDNGDAMNLEVSIGTPLQPFLQGNDAVKLIFERAIARATARQEQKSDSETKSLRTRALPI